MDGERVVVKKMPTVDDVRRRLVEVEGYDEEDEYPDEEELARLESTAGLGDDKGDNAITLELRSEFMLYCLPPRKALHILAQLESAAEAGQAKEGVAGDDRLLAPLELEDPDAFVLERVEARERMRLC